ncbi:MAG: hypothetical protein ACFFC7_09120 [Candidatus Hermodarchaeota archaeon]
MPSTKTVNIILAMIIAVGGFLLLGILTEAVEAVIRMTVFFSIALYILLNNEEKTANYPSKKKDPLGAKIEL